MSPTLASCMSPVSAEVSKPFSNIRISEYLSSSVHQDTVLTPKRKRNRNFRYLYPLSSGKRNDFSIEWKYYQLEAIATNYIGKSDEAVSGRVRLARYGCRGV